MLDFRSPPAKVQLLAAFDHPYQTAVAAARTCYTAKGVIQAGQTKPEVADRIGRSVFEAGHHTTFQHGQMMFGLTGVSRHFLWGFLHSHPFYNSEQVSQRYTKVKASSFVVPEFRDSALQALYETEIERTLGVYRQLAEALEPFASREYFRIFKARGKQPERWKKPIQKKCFEVARYVLPVATTAHLYHSVSVLTLLRYHRLCGVYDLPSEQKQVVQAMVELALEHDPELEKILQEPLDPEDTPEARFLEGRVPQTSAFRREFDAELEGRRSRLIGRKPENVALVARGVREVLGLSRSELSDPEAVALALDPGKNPILGETMNLTTHSKLTRALHHAHYSFQKKLSHSADSQDQRHRMTPASRPMLEKQVDGEPDFEVPALLEVEGAEDLLALYRDSMAQSFEVAAKIRAKSGSDEAGVYLLPNATSLRFTESSDLLNLRHKLAMRLCYNAQEEIFWASVEEAQQIRELEPEIGSLLLPPCTARKRAEVRPLCPEGDRYCGVQVWKLDLDEYERVI